MALEANLAGAFKFSGLHESYVSPCKKVLMVKNLFILSS